MLAGARRGDQNLAMQGGRRAHHHGFHAGRRKRRIEVRLEHQPAFFGLRLAPHGILIPHDDRFEGRMVTYLVGVTSRMNVREREQGNSDLAVGCHNGTSSPASYTYRSLSLYSAPLTPNPAGRFIHERHSFPAASAHRCRRSPR